MSPVDCTGSYNLTPILSALSHIFQSTSPVSLTDSNTDNSAVYFTFSLIVCTFKFNFMSYLYLHNSNIHNYFCFKYPWVFKCIKARFTCSLQNPVNCYAFLALRPKPQAMATRRSPLTKPVQKPEKDKASRWGCRSEHNFIDYIRLHFCAAIAKITDILWFSICKFCMDYTDFSMDTKMP